MPLKPMKQLSKNEDSQRSTSDGFASPDNKNKRKIANKRDSIFTIES